MILIGLGANLSGPHGSPEEALQACADVFLRRGLPIIQSSCIWASAPVPASDQPWYRNAVAEVETALEPLDLIAVLNSIEEEFGRMRTVRNAPRVLDLDVLAYYSRIENYDNLIVPHPRMHERAFVLYPLQEIAPGWVHPVSGQSVEEMIAALPPDQEINRLDATLFYEGKKND